MALRTDQLLQHWGPCLGDLPPDGVELCERVSTDSREDLGGALFIALVGERFDGHAFLERALSEGGAAAAVAQRDRLSPAEAEDLCARSGRPLWLVADTVLAYQQLGRLWRRQLGAAVVAVTGSAGKTTTREIIRSALAPLGPVVASSGNENNDVGVPLTLFKADAASAALVVEMGMRGLGEIERLSACAEPDVAVITNIGTAHIGRLGSREAIARAKCEIVTGLSPGGLMVIPAGDPLLETTLAGVWNGRVLRVALADDLAGFDPACPPADLVGRLDPAGTALNLEPGSTPPTGDSPTGDSAGEACRIELPLSGRHNARNLLLAVAVAVELGLAPAALQQLVVEVPGGRNRRLSLGGVQLLDETYNASPEAVLAALEMVAAQPGRRYAVLGTMLELGEQSLELHRQVARRAAQLGFDGLVIVAGGAEGQAMEQEAAGLARLMRVDQPAEAAPPLLAWLECGDRLLLKASRGVALEQLIPLLEAGLTARG